MDDNYELSKFLIQYLINISKHLHM